MLKSKSTVSEKNKKLNPQVDEDANKKHEKEIFLQNESKIGKFCFFFFNPVCFRYLEKPYWPHIRYD